MPFPCIRKLECTLQKLFDKNEPKEGFIYFNPSIAYPYLYVRGTKKENRIETNHIFIYDFTIDTIKEIDVPYEKLVPTYGIYRGLEDMRIIMYQDRLWFIASSTHVSASMQSEMIIGYFNKELDKIEYLQHIDFGCFPIKNICPFIYQNKFCVIDIFTLNIYEIIENENIYQSLLLKTLKPCHNLNYETMRGSTSPIHLHGNIWGCVVHNQIMKAESRSSLAYVSYWMEFDIDCGIVTFISSPFYIMCWGIEFISGIQYFKETDIIELYLGINDNIAVVAYTNLYNIRYG